MKTVVLEIQLELDVDTQEELEEVLQEMDYSFSYVKIVEDNVGKGLSEKEYITKTELIS